MYSQDHTAELSTVLGVPGRTSATHVPSSGTYQAARAHFYDLMSPILRSMSLRSQSSLSSSSSSVSARIAHMMLCCVDADAGFLATGTLIDFLRPACGSSCEALLGGFASWCSGGRAASDCGACEGCCRGVSRSLSLTNGLLSTLLLWCCCWGGGAASASGCGVRF